MEVNSKTRIFLDVLGALLHESVTDEIAAKMLVDNGYSSDIESARRTVLLIHNDISNSRMSKNNAEDSLILSTRTLPSGIRYPREGLPGSKSTMHRGNSWTCLLTVTNRPEITWLFGIYRERHREFISTGSGSAEQAKRKK